SKATITPEALQRAIRVAIEHCAMERRIHEQRSSLEIFTRALAHDLKEPVRTIKSFLSVSHRTKRLRSGVRDISIISRARPIAWKRLSTPFISTRGWTAESRNLARRFAMSRPC